jgi:hypothetical protein
MDRADEAESDPAEPPPAEPGAGEARQRSRRARRQAERATRSRHARLGVAGVTLGTVAAILAVWMITGWRGVTLDTGRVPPPSTSNRAALTQRSPAAPPNRTTTGPTGGTTPTATEIARRMAAALSPVSRLGLVAADPTYHASGFAPLCGSESRGAPEYLVGFVSRNLTGTRAGVPVTILQSEAVYRRGGVQALLAESTGVFCAGYVDAPPGSPEGSVLLRGRAGGKVIAYLVAPTSARTALYVEASAVSDDAITAVVDTVLPGLIADAQRDAAALLAATPGA